jgi:hypothetical protein
VTGQSLASADLPGLRQQLGRDLRVGVARVDGLGDWILTIPLLRGLTDSAFVESVTALTPNYMAPLFDRLPGVQGEGIGGSQRWLGRSNKVFRKTIGPRLGRLRAAQNGKRFRGRFDVIILPRWDSDREYNLRSWAWATGALVAGHDPWLVPQSKRAERGDRSLLWLVASDDRVTAHDLVHSEFLGQELGIQLGNAEKCGRTLLGDDIAVPELPRRFAVAHIGAGVPKRCWPTTHWVECIDGAYGMAGIPTVLLGSAAEAETAREIQRRCAPGAAIYLGALALTTTVAIIGRSEYFVGGDSGLMHVASSLDIPSLVISPHPRHGDPAHPNSPNRFGPWGTDVVVLQPDLGLPPCERFCSAPYPHCITEVRASQALVALPGFR